MSSSATESAIRGQTGFVLDGAKDEQKFKDYLRRHQMPTQAWYNAHPGLTALDKWRNTLIREGLEQGNP